MRQTKSARRHACKCSCITYTHQSHAEHHKPEANPPARNTARRNAAQAVLQLGKGSGRRDTESGQLLIDRARHLDVLEVGGWLAVGLLSACWLVGWLVGLSDHTRARHLDAFKVGKGGGAAEGAGLRWHAMAFVCRAKPALQQMPRTATASSAFLCPHALQW